MVEQNKENQLTNQQKYFICNQICFWFYQILVISLALVVLGLVSISYEQTQKVLKSSQIQHSKETIKFWQQGYIIDIRVENTNNCPEGYSPFINHTWPGTINGCSCPSSSTSSSMDFVLVGKCSSNLIALGCTTISAKNSYILNMWKGGKLICYKRAHSMNFYNSILTTSPTGGSSPSMTPCADSQSYKVYTLPGVPCPVTTISNGSLGLSQTTLTLDTLYNYQLNFNTQMGYPIADIKLSQYQFCPFFSNINISPNKQGTYALQLKPRDQPCSSTDPRMITVDALNQQDFYTNNTRVFEMISELPAYPTPSVDYNYLLGYVPYPAWTYQCRISNSYNLREATKHLLFQDASNAVIICTSVVLPCVLILVFLFRLFYIIRHIIELKSRNSYKSLMLSDDEIAQQIPTLNIWKSSKRQVCYFVLQLILILGISGSIVYAIVMQSNSSIWIKNIIKNECTEDYLQKIFLYYESKIDYNTHILLKSIFVILSLLIIHIIYFTLRFYIGDLFKKKQVVQEKSVISNEQLQPADVLNKQGQLQGINNMQDSSQIIINRQHNSELKVYDMDYLMGEGGQTKDNFYVGISGEPSLSVVKKKKKKQLRKNRKNLFKDDQK